MSLEKNNCQTILGVKVSPTAPEELRAVMAAGLKEDVFRYAVTVNPEFILAAKKDEEFLFILNSADYSLADAFGLVLAGWFLGRLIRRYPGADLATDLLAIAAEERYRVAVVLWKDGLSRPDEASAAIKKRHPGLEFMVAEEGRETRTANVRLATFKPHIVLVALGAPDQEKYIYHAIRNMPGVRLAAGIGGSIDFITGRIRRAPPAMRRLGLEWLWRLAHVFAQTDGHKLKRFRRIGRAVFVFPYEFFKWRFIHPFLYRPNVACFLYKKDAGGYQVLLVERALSPGHWQLPQGGTDGRSHLEAGTRELAEELNCRTFRPVKAYGNLRRYEFNGQTGKYRTDARASWGYRGQKQGLLIAEFTGRDEDIKINFFEHRAWKWVRAENLTREVYPVRREAAALFYSKFKELITNE